MSVISINIHVDDLGSVLALFDKIQVWRAPSEFGTYVEITAPTDIAASLSGAVVGPFAVSGLGLSIVANNADPLVVTFTGTDPLTLSQIIAAINAVFPGFASEAAPNTNKLKITSPVLGTRSELQVSGAAAAVLGLSTSKVNGKTARISLTNPTTEYQFRDYDGLDTFFYETRFYSTITQQVSSFSDPRQGNPQTVIPAGSMVKATVRLADAAGRPVIGRRVIFVVQSPSLIDTGAGGIYGILPGGDRVVATTDEFGVAAEFLTKGVTVRAFLEGTGYQREFVVPNADFDVLVTMSTKVDPFSIVQSPPMPIRTT